MPARAATPVNRLDTQCGVTGPPLAVTNSGVPGSCLLPTNSLNLRWSRRCETASRSMKVVYRALVLTRTSRMGTG